MIIPPPDTMENIDLRPSVCAQRPSYTNTQVDASTIMTNSLGLSLKYEVIRLTEESYGRFMLILNADKHPNENLRRAIQKHRR